VQRQRWYRLRPRPACGGDDGPETVERFRALFLDAVRLRLTRADVEVGSCLSGGLDSSSIVCSLDRLEAGRARGHQTFSIVFPDTPLDESPYVRQVVGRTGVRSHLTTTGGAALREQIDRLVAVQDEPFASATVFAQWEVMRLAHREGIKVLLDGQGGDELLAGYLFLAGYRLLDYCLGGRPWEAMAETAGFVRLHGLQPDPFLVAVGVCLPRWLRTRLSRRYLRVPLAPEFAARHAAHSRVPDALYRRMSLAEALAQRTTIGLQQLLRAEDRNAMAFAIEARLPFLDHRLVGDPVGIPAGDTQYILRPRRAAAGPGADQDTWGVTGYKPLPFGAGFLLNILKRHAISSSRLTAFPAVIRP
jgi:asparagine synthase (glutamine-hydrolysing)